eukprot:6479250-Prymnesium_polylepis.4
MCFAPSFLRSRALAFHADLKVKLPPASAILVSLQMPYAEIKARQMYLRRAKTTSTIVRCFFLFCSPPQQKKFYILETKSSYLLPFTPKLTKRRLTAL